MRRCFGLAPQSVSPRRAAALRLAVCAAAVLFYAESWQLWVAQDVYPIVPFIGRMPQFSGTGAWVAFAGLMIALALAAAGGLGRWALGGFVLVNVVLVLQDQHRFQPWVEQFSLIALALAACSSRRTFGLVRWLTIGLYLHSGLSKLDASFQAETGRYFLHALARALGISTAFWPPGWMTMAILAMPATEILVAVGLYFHATRRWAVGGSIVMHLALLVILGPWGLDHTAIVLGWNIFMTVQNVILFGSGARWSGRPGPGTPPPPDPPPGRRILARGTATVFAVAVILPFGERFGLIDAWPAFALYASHPERTDVFIHQIDLDRLPPAIQRFTFRNPRNGPWRSLSLGRWSEAVFGVPVYPQSRVRNGIAEAVCERFRPTVPMIVIQTGPAGRGGRRRRTELEGCAEIRRYGDHYWLNAHPVLARFYPNWVPIERRHQSKSASEE